MTLAFLFVSLLVPLSSFAATAQVSDPTFSDDRSSVRTQAQFGPERFNGSASYSIPIAVPAGRNGQTPDLKLIYNSQSAGQDVSPFGYGWNVSIPYIQRLNKEGVDHLYSGDYFFSSLDGELASTSVTTYRPVADESFVQYSFSTSTSSWVVTDKVGAIYTFGTSANARQDNPFSSSQVYTWMLDKVVDTNGNYITYSYYKEAGQVYIDTITYTGNGATPGTLTVEFGREPREDTLTSYRTGFEVASDYVINEIRVKVDGTLVRKYVLGYGTGTNYNRNVLASVTETGYDESGTATALPSTLFTYERATGGYADASGTWNAPVNFADYNKFTSGNAGVLIVDVNGDGLNDILQSYRTASSTATSSSAWLNTGSGWSASTVWKPPAYLADYEITQRGDGGVRALDVNGDGLVDIVQSYYISPTSSSTMAWINNSNGWTASSTWNPPNWISESQDKGMRALDVNGDGLVDWIQSYVDASGVQQQKRFINNGHGWTQDTTRWSVPVGFLSYQGAPSNGDPEIGVRFGDVNADGLVDIVQGSASTLKAWINNGTGWVSNNTFAPPEAFVNCNASSCTDLGARFFDANGDGISDLIRTYSSGGTTVNAAWIGTGKGFYQDSSWVPPVSFGWYAIASSGDGGVRTLDLDGDNMQDLIYAYKKSDSTTGAMAYLAAGNKPDLLKSVRTKTGETVTFTYKQTPLYGTGASQNPKLPITVDTLDTATSDSGFGPAKTTTYSYYDGSYYYKNPLERQFAGFKKTKETDALGNYSFTYFHTATGTESSIGEVNDIRAKVGKSFRTENYDQSGNLYSKSITRWGDFNLGGGRTFIFASSTASFQYDGDADHKEKAESYAYATTTGNLTQKVEWGEVSGSDDGTFSDIGSDKRSTAISYAATTTQTSVTVSTDAGANTYSIGLTRSSSQYLSITDAAQTGLDASSAISLEAWIKMSTLPAVGDFYTILSKREGATNNREYSFIVRNNGGSYKLVLMLSPDGATYSYMEIPWTSPTAGTWYHVAATWSQASDLYTAYVNGSSIGTYDTSNPGEMGTNNIYNSTATFRIGAEEATPSNFFNGLVDDVRVWNVERTGTQINTNKASELTGSESGLVGYWKLNNVATDETANNNDLTAQNSPAYSSSVGFGGAGSVSLPVTLSIVGFPSQETVTDQSATKVKEAKHYYDGLALNSLSKGNETKTELWKTGSVYASTTKAYNLYGLVASSTDPRGKVTNYTYDSKNLYVATSTNPLSQTTQFYYDYSLGKPKQTIDPNGRVFQTTYDGLDRPVAELQPDIASPGSLLTKKGYTYTDTLGSRSILETNYLDGSNNFTLYTYLDGLSRTIQTRKEAEANSRFATRDFAYDSRGLLQKESLPYFSPGPGLTSATTSNALYTAYTYDPQKRVTAVGTAVGTTTSAYDQWVTTVTDALGKAKDFTYDAFGRLSQVVEHNAGSNYTTAYTYDGADNLTKITDALSNIRNFTYDGLARRLTAQDLHASADGTFGTWLYEYDDAGNLASSTDPKSQRINYIYDNVNRALTEDYAGQAGVETSYSYDACTEGIARLCTATSTGAVTKYAYNALGLTATENKTIATTTYATSYLYDRQGNLTNIIYPDSSEVQYTYNTAGLLETVAQKESGGSFANLINDFDYAPTEKVSFKGFANGVESTYVYDPNQLYRLTAIYTATTSIASGSFSLIVNFNKYLAKASEYLPLAMKNLALADTDTMDTIVDAGAETTTPAILIPDTATDTPLILPEVPLETGEVLGDATSTPPVEETASSTEPTPEPVPEPVLELPQEPEPEPEKPLEVATSTDAVAQAVPESNYALLASDTEKGRTEVTFATERPEVTITKWDGEGAIAIAYTKLATTSTLSKDRSEWKGDTEELHAYTLPAHEGMEGGGVEVAVVLKEKPESNVFDFTITGADTLDFFYQPELTKEEIDQGDQRPENVIGSYAVYHKNKSGHADGELNFETGKAFHIYRPKIVDAKGNETWGALAYLPAQEGKEGSLSVTVPQEFLDKAEYPVTVDPTFGNSAVGASSAIYTGRHASPFTSPSAGGTIYALSAYVGCTAGTAQVGTAIYADSTTTPGTPGLFAATDSGNASVAGAGWYTTTLSYQYATSSTLWLAGWMQPCSSSGAAVYYYDTGALNQEARSANDTFENWPQQSYNASSTMPGRIDSIYASYAEGTGVTSAPRAVDLERSSSQYLAITDASQTGLNVSSAITIEAWIKIESLPASGETYVIASKREGAIGQRQYSFAVRNNGGTYQLLLVASYTGGNVDLVAPINWSSPSAGTWYHVAATWSQASDTYTAYVNGSSIGTYNTVADMGTNNIYSGTAAFRIGAEEQTPSNFFDGVIDDLRVWNVERTGTQINQSKDAELVGNESGLVGYWKLNDSAVDTTSNHNNLTAYNTPLYTDGHGFSGNVAYTPRAIDLESTSSQSLSISNASQVGLAITGNLTIEAWLQVESAPAGGETYPIATKWNGTTGNRSYALWYRNYGGAKQLVFTWSPDGAATVDEADLNYDLGVGAWHHVAVVFTAASHSAEFFIDGVSVGSLSGASTSILNGYANFVVGASDGGTSYFDGVIDDLRVWNTARTVTQINSFKSIELLGNESGLMGYWKFNDNPNDATNNHNNLTPNNAPAYGPGVGLSYAPTELLTEGVENPTLVTDPTPEFSAVYHNATSTSAVAYKLQVGTERTFASPYWDSGKLSMATTSLNARSPDISYAGTALASSTLYYWRIKFYDTLGTEDPWSEVTASFSLQTPIPGNGYPSYTPVSGGIQNLRFTYDAVGNITQVKDTSTFGLARTTAYGYDDLYRLTSASTTMATSTSYRYQYGYDALGNLTGMKLGSGATTTYTYAGTGNANPHAATTIGGQTLVYDNNGNATSYSGNTYTWDYMNRMTKTGTTTTTFYTYDQGMNRVTKGPGVGSQNATTTYPSMYYNLTSATTTKQVYANGELIATLVKVGAASTTKQYVHTDWLGSTNAVTDNTGKLVEAIDYYPYGTERLREMVSGTIKSVLCLRDGTRTES